MFLKILIDYGLCLDSITLQEVFTCRFNFLLWARGSVALYPGLRICVGGLRDYYWFLNGTSFSKVIVFVLYVDKQAKFTVTNHTIFDSGVYDTVMGVNTYTTIINV